MASYNCNFISKLLQGGKIWWIFAQLLKNSTHCFVLKLSTVSRFQNRICIGLFQKKSKQRSWGQFLKKTPGIFRFITLIFEVPDKIKLHPWKFYKIVLHHWNFQGKKARPMEISHDFFLMTLGNSTSFFNDPLNFYILFFNNPGNSMSSTSPVWMFSGMAHWKSGEKKYKCIWLSITQNLKTGKTINRIKHKICLRQWAFELSNLNFW